MKDIKLKSGTKERLIEMFNKTYSLNAVENVNYQLDTYFEKLINGELNITSKDVKEIPNKKNEFVITINCLDKSESPTEMCFTFFCMVNELNVDNVHLIKNCFLYSLYIYDINGITYDKDYLEKFNQINKEKIVDYLSNLVELESDEVNEDLDKYGKMIDKYGFTSNDVVSNTYNALNDDKKRKYIEKAKEMMDLGLIAKGRNPNEYKDNPDYRLKIKNLAIVFFQKHVENLNEKNDYPKEIGHKFKIKKQYKIDKKRRKPVTRINEDD